MSSVTRCYEIPPEPVYTGAEFSPLQPYSPTGCREGQQGPCGLGADDPADKNKTTTFLWWTWTVPKSRTTEIFSWWTSAPASAGRGALARARSAGHFSDGAISSTGLGLRRTRPPGPPVGGQERFFGERGTAGPESDATISFGLPFEPEDSQYGESRVKCHRRVAV